MLCYDRKPQKQIMSTKMIVLLIGIMPLLINGIHGRYLDCLKNQWPGVKPVNSTHIKVGWTKGDGSGFENCDDSEQHIYFEDYEIILDGKSLGIQRHTRKEYSAIIKADPCLKHDVVVNLKFIMRIWDMRCGKQQGKLTITIWKK